jgi:hypothetical protein
MRRRWWFCAECSTYAFDHADAYSDRHTGTARRLTGER